MSIAPRRAAPLRRRFLSPAPGKKLLLFNKPYGVVSQFLPAYESNAPTLKDFIPFPKLYPAGRLDKDSEGLLLLTDDGRLQHQLSDPRYKCPKTYWIQVEGLPSEEALAALRAGVMLKDGLTAPAQVQRLADPKLWAREPPIRMRRNQPTSWLAITLSEGRNRQVRRMAAAVGFPVLRLVRVQIGSCGLAGLSLGAFCFAKKI